MAERKRKKTLVDNIPAPEGDVAIPSDLSSPVMNNATSPRGDGFSSPPTSPRGGLASTSMEENVQLRCAAGVGYDPKKQKKGKKETNKFSKKDSKGSLLNIKLKKKSRGPTLTVEDRIEGIIVSCHDPYKPTKAQIGGVFSGETPPTMAKSDIHQLVSSLTRKNLCLTVLGQIELTKPEMAITSCIIPLLFEKANRIDRFVENVVDQELEASPKALPFKSNALHVKVIITYHTMVCQNYLRDVLAPLVFSANDACNNAATAFEVDPALMKNKETLAQHRSTLLMSIQNLMNSLLRSLFDYPFSARFLCRYIVRRLEEENRANLQVPAVFGLFFQRYFVPALMAPIESQVVSGNVSPSCKKMLNLMGKALLNYTADKKFPEKEGPEAHLGFINPVFDLFTEYRQNIFEALLRQEKAQELREMVEDKESKGLGMVPMSPVMAGEHTTHRPRKNTGGSRSGGKKDKAAKEGVETGEIRMEQRGKKTEMRGGFVLLDEPPQTIQDLRPIIGMQFFDFLKHFHLQTSDPVAKLLSLPEKQWEKCPFPKEMITHLRLNLSLAAPQDGSGGEAPRCSMPMVVKHNIHVDKNYDPASPFAPVPPSSSPSSSSPASPPTSLLLPPEENREKGKRESLSQALSWGSGLDRPLAEKERVKKQLPKPKLYLVSLKEEVASWEDGERGNVTNEALEEKKREKFGFQVRLIGKNPEEEESAQNVFILGRENRKLNLNDKKVSRRQASISYLPAKKEYYLKAEGLNAFFVRSPQKDTKTKMSKGDTFTLKHCDIIHISELWEWEVHIVTEEYVGGDGKDFQRCATDLQKLQGSQTPASVSESMANHLSPRGGDKSGRISPRNSNQNNKALEISSPTGSTSPPVVLRSKNEPPGISQSPPAKEGEGGGVGGVVLSPKGPGKSTGMRVRTLASRSGRPAGQAPSPPTSPPTSPSSSPSSPRSPPGSPPVAESSQTKKLPPAKQVKYNIYEPDHHDILFGALAKIILDHDDDITEVVQADDVESLWAKLPKMQHYFP